MAGANTVFWDNGGVILTNGWDRAGRRAVVDKFKLDWEDFADRHELMLNAFETGHATLDEYLQRVIFYRHRDFTMDEVKAFIFNLSQPLPESFDYFKKLAATKRYAMLALNNESREINEHRIRTFELRKYFEAFLCSCYLGVRKPDEKIYRMALSLTQSPPEECVFVDDRGLNLEIPKELGMHTIQFKNPAQMREDLARYGVTAD
jgi:putative hydrolase of the HAD superfamily